MATPNEPGKGWSIPRIGCLYCAVVLFILGGYILIFPFERKEVSAGWLRSSYHVAQIGTAIHSYHAVNGQLPDAVVTDKKGRPLYSWRVTLLPYLEELRVYKEFKLDEPWDSPHNKRLVEHTPRCYVPQGGGIDAPGLTRYLVFVGPGTAFERPGMCWDKLPHSGENMMLLGEAADPVPWTKPVDLVYDPDGPLPALKGHFTKPVYFLDYVLWRTSGFNASFGDGSTRFIPSKTDEKTLREMISPPR
jgi:hypothetical protein